MKPIVQPLKSLSISAEEPVKVPRNDDRPPIEKELREQEDRIEGETRTLETPHFSVSPSSSPVKSRTEETKSSSGEKLEFRERSLRASEESAISRTIDTAFYTSMKMSKTSDFHVSNDLLHKAIVTGEEIDVLGILWDLGGGALQAITARDTEGRTSVHIATLVGSARIITLLLETYRLYEGQQLEYDLIRLNEEHQSTLDDLRMKIASLQANGSMNSNNKSIKREIDGQVAAVEEWFEKERARR